MKKFLNIELNNYQKTLLWILSITGLLAKILLESILFMFNEFQSTLSIILKFALSLTISLPMIIIFYLTFKSKLNDWMVTSEFYFKELWQILLLNISLLILSAFLPESIISGGNPTKISEIIYINIFAFFGLFLSVYSYNFIIKWIWIRRFSNTKMYIRILLILTVIFIFIIEVPNLFNHLYPEDIQESNFLLAFSIIFNVSLIVIAWLASGKSSWIATLRLPEKWKLVAISVLMILIESIFFFSEMQESGDGKLSNTMNYNVPGGTLLGISSLLLLIYFIRTTLSSFLTMPTSGILEKKANELSSITYLNRLVSQSIDLDNLIDSVTKLTLYSSGASAVWTDIIDKNSQRIIKSCQHMNKEKFSCDSISDELTKRFYSNVDSTLFIENLKEPLYIESIKDFSNPAINEIERIFNAKSMIIMPLLSSNDKIGTLYLTHPVEYGFEQDYMNVLRAFNDNINIAIENLRLLEISIEQERYKKELMIARDIESRLIPAHLPGFVNYSLAGFTLQADEVGGDYFELVKLSDGSNCLLIADVSGKGMSAAFYMVLLKGVVISVANRSSSPKDLLQNINSILYKQMENKVFITMSAVKFSDKSNTIELSRAGHMPFMLFRNRECVSIKPTGLGIGLASPLTFNKHLEQEKIQLEDGDLLMMYSDGLTEMTIDGVQAGEEFLKQIIHNSVYNSSDDVLKEIRIETDRIRQNSNINDDMTIVSLKYHQNK